MSEKKAKFTAIDAIIILVILAVIVVGAIKILPRLQAEVKKKRLILQLWFKTKTRTLQMQSR